MNKVFLCMMVILFVISFAFGAKGKKFLAGNQEILTVNNLSEVYNSNIQQEMVRIIYSNWNFFLFPVSLFRLQMCFQMHLNYQR